MRLYLIRHADAGDRGHGPHDLFRPLSDRGHQRAREISDLLAPMGVRHILSSPATRCVQTVEPLAARLGLMVEEHPDLWEQTFTSHVLTLLAAQPESPIAVCSHGNVIPGVVEAVTALGALATGRGCEKGSMWILDHDGGSWTRATYVDGSRAELPELDALP